jgi:hypothetical protein
MLSESLQMPFSETLTMHLDGLTKIPDTLTLLSESLTMHSDSLWIP